MSWMCDYKCSSRWYLSLWWDKGQTGQDKIHANLNSRHTPENSKIYLDHSFARKVFIRKNMLFYLTYQKNEDNFEHSTLLWKMSSWLSWYQSMHSAGISHIRHATQAALACPELLHTCKLLCNPLSKKLLYMVYDLMVIFIVIGISSVLVADLSVFLLSIYAQGWVGMS